MVILSVVIASVVAEIGLGSEPAFTLPNYDFRSPSVSVPFSRCTTFMVGTIDNVQKLSSFPKSIFPMLGGLAVGLIALAYPEILYLGFENVDMLLESRPLVEGIYADRLLQLVVNICYFTLSGIWFSWRLLCTILVYWGCYWDGLWKNRLLCDSSVQPHSSFALLGSCITKSVWPVTI